MLSASKKIDYGILLMASLPESGHKDFRSLQDIADEKHLSAGYLSQLMMPLKKSGLVKAREGLHGGYQLSKNREEITLADIFTALEGPLALTSCLNQEKSCVCEKQCPTKSIWADLQELMNGYLSNKTLADIYNSL
jgi:Rrf2 family cysteine metabolism transcriptional repressor